MSYNLSSLLLSLTFNMFFCHFPAKARLTLTRATHVVSVRSGACRRWYQQQYFQELLSQFPPVDHAVAYGSGVFKQGSCPLPEVNLLRSLMN